MNEGRKANKSVHCLIKSSAFRQLSRGQFNLPRNHWSIGQHIFPTKVGRIWYLLYHECSTVLVKTVGCTCSFSNVFYFSLVLSQQICFNVGYMMAVFIIWTIPVCPKSKAYTVHSVNLIYYHFFLLRQFFLVLLWMLFWNDLVHLTIFCFLCWTQSRIHFDVLFALKTDTVNLFHWCRYFLSNDPAQPLWFEMHDVTSYLALKSFRMCSFKNYMYRGCWFNLLKTKQNNNNN